MATLEPQAFDGRKKQSQILTTVEDLIENNPQLEDELEDLKIIINLSESRHAQLLEDKEYVILSLQGAELKSIRTAKSLEKQLSVFKDENAELQKLLADSERARCQGVEAFKEIESALKKELDLKKQTKATTDSQIDNLAANAKLYEEEIENSESEKIRAQEQLRAAQAEIAELEKRETSLVDVITSLRAKQPVTSAITLREDREGLVGKWQGPNKVGGNKRKFEETVEATVEIPGPKIKQEYEEMMPKIKAKHWAPDGYYHVREHFRRRPVRKGAPESEKARPTSHEITVVD